MKQILYRLFRHQHLGQEEARNILQNIAGGRYNDSQIASLTTVLLMRSTSVEGLTGFWEALLEMYVSVDPGKYKPIDIVGAGGGGKSMFNISTRSRSVTAGAGYHVTKHGNYGATSVGSASNAMEQHGVKLTNDIDKLRTSMDICHTACLHAPLLNPALKAVAPVRKSLGVCSFFNTLGPLVSPVMPTYQLLGVYNLPLLRLYNYTYQESDTRSAAVYSLDGYDGVSLTADFEVVTPEKEKLYTPETFGFKRRTEADLDGGETPEEVARIFDAVLGNRATEAQRSCVIANSVFAIQVICPEKKIEMCIVEARESLENGKALATFRRFISLNHW